MTFFLFLASLAWQQPIGALSSAPDTTVVVQGLLVQVPPNGAWLLALPTPFKFRDRVIAELDLTGNTSRWSGFAGHYVEARGVLAGDPAAGPRARGRFMVATVREVDPPGAVHKNVTTSWSSRAAMTLWVLPHRITWVDAEGRPTGVGPAIMYTLNYHGEADVTLTFESKDFVCFTVEPQRGGAPAWHFKRQLQQPTDRLKVTLPKFVREVARLPQDGAPEAGKYLVRAGLCGYKEYELETELEVVR